MKEICIIRNVYLKIRSKINDLCFHFKNSEKKKKHSLDFKGITLHNKIGFGQAIEWYFWDQQLNDTLHSNINQIFYIYKNLASILNRMALKLGKIDILKISNLSIHENGSSLHLFRYFISVINIFTFCIQILHQIY